MEIEAEAGKVLKELAKALGEAEFEETYYLFESANPLREDGKIESNPGRRELILKNAPRRDEEGYIIAEVGAWAV